MPLTQQLPVHSMAELIHFCLGGLSWRQAPQTNIFDMWLHALQADSLAHGGGGRVWRSIGIAASYLLNRLPAAAEAALSGDATFPGAPYLPLGGDNHITMGECAATAVPHVAPASLQ